MSSNTPHTWLKIALPILVLLLGVGATAALISSRQAPEPTDRPRLGALVESVVVSAESLAVVVKGQGEVTPKTRVELLPEVTGRVVKIHRGLVAGGRFRAGETLVQIDPRDYELAVQRASASVARAEVALLRERAEADAALAEWQAIHGDAEPPSLLVREPQIRQAEAEHAAAEADLASAELALDRTRIQAPFHGLVIQESVDVGQLLGPGRAVATVIGTDALEVRVPLDDSEMAWFDPPAPAEVTVDFAGRRQTWPATVTRFEGQVDPRSRMVHVVVEVERPFDVGTGDGDGNGRTAPLMPGTFADVAIEGRILENVIPVSRSTLRGDDRIWVAEGDQLRIRAVEIARRERDLAYVRAGSGLASGDRVITSALDAPVDGMKIRLLEDQASGPDAPEADAPEADGSAADDSGAGR